VLVQSNFGSAPELVIGGVPIGRHLEPPPPPAAKSEGESIMIIVATDAPLDSRQLGRLCRRAAFGLARTGSTCHASSGDFVIAFATANRIADRPDRTMAQQPGLHEQSAINPFFTAVIEGVEEAIYNSLLMAQTVTGRDGNTRYGLPAEAVAALLRRYERIA
jgi:D-aminopeptidase